MICGRVNNTNYRSVPFTHPGKGDGSAYPGGHHQASGGKEGYQE